MSFKDFVETLQPAIERLRQQQREQTPKVLAEIAERLQSTTAKQEGSDHESNPPSEAPPAHQTLEEWFNARAMWTHKHKGAHNTGLARLYSNGAKLYYGGVSSPDLIPSDTTHIVSALGAEFLQEEGILLISQEMCL